jgi:hypothetical protein
VVIANFAQMLEKNAIHLALVVCLLAKLILTTDINAQGRRHSAGNVETTN